jgi:integrase
MTIHPNLLVGYDPKCSLFKRERASGKVMWYISYYLPNNQRIRRPLNKDHREAKTLKLVKEKQLLRGMFDSKDKEHLKDMLPAAQTERLSINKGITLYHRLMDSGKTPKSRKVDQSQIRLAFKFFKNQGKAYMDQIKRADIRLLVGYLDETGYAASTIEDYVKSVRKVFNCLVDEAETLEANPVPSLRKMRLPRKDGLARKRLLSDVEVQALLNAQMPKERGFFRTPIKDIVCFIAYTGCRVGEALHAEWADFDFDQGIWYVRIKPNCPTMEKLGWAPKWYKERDVILTAEAMELLKSMPVVESNGAVQIRDKDGKIVGHERYPAHFVFPKKHVIGRVGQGQTYEYHRVDSIKKTWATLVRVSGVDDVQLKDLRTWFNHRITSEFGFSAKEAGAYIGNSEMINKRHYTPVSMDVVRRKLGGATAAGTHLEMSPSCHPRGKIIKFPRQKPQKPLSKKAVNPFC